MTQDHFNARDLLITKGGQYTFYRLDALEKAGLVRLKKLPFSIRVLLESALRQVDDKGITPDDVKRIAAWTPNGERPGIPFKPSRVVMQDFTGVPAVVDLAAMRSAVARLGGDPKKVNPLVPVELVIDHSVQVDFFGTPDALQRNTEIEFQRNKERYEFLKWGQKAFDNFRVVPPSTGIIHQVNLEHLSECVPAREVDGELQAFADTLVGTDSHTVMINGLGVLGWGVGGIEAEASMLGQPLDMLLPDVVGFKLFGEMQEGVTATDLVLTAVQMLREQGVVGKFVEFYGPGLDSMSLPDRATIANMAPEYGATMGFFPVDEETLRYLRLTGRSEETIERTKAYLTEQGLFRTSETPDPEFTATLELDLGTVVPSLAGPKRPQDRIALTNMKQEFQKALTAEKGFHGFGLSADEAKKKATVGTNGGGYELGHGALVIAAITSCTNTSNPSVLVGAGLLAKKALELGLEVAPQVKTSLAPGSRVVTEYLRQANLIEPLAKLGFGIVGYGCTTCIGNSGPLPSEVAKAVTSEKLIAAAVTSGNRNFEGRVHPMVQASYLASPPLVVAYALAGTVDIDLATEAIGTGVDGNPVYLKDIWPSTKEIMDVVAESVKAEMFKEKYAEVFAGDELWNEIKVSEGDLYAWDESSTYIQHPPFFQSLTLDLPPVEDIHGARVLALLKDSITTDHISPAGNIPADGPAGKYLQSKGVKVNDFNSFGSRRGNDQVMARGTFANIRLKNKLVPGVEGGYTRHLPDGGQISIFDAAVKYARDETPLIVLTGAQYGTGSSRDWAAKGTLMLGVKAVIATSYERIHRSNLVGMGVIPLQFAEGESAESLGLTGEETFDITGLKDIMAPMSDVSVTATKTDGSTVAFTAKALLNTEIEVEYYRNGGILHTVLRNMVR
ncbi:MAG: aconitate hydratase AcnA [Anaerolineales bacterium]|uniref:Aconitate hydratase n=1 Tax=Candidatus Desulfolinea nitratireducens TaxID=2841698 RepID=A0A8J6NMN2_9CHLR|nr:aconitate hydratase AcnA [Candidatus Desulfolinea nitratireducens]MBL6959478.1 aconitate hydratase AcnA [Anaerolineales bacterium]